MYLIFGLGNPGRDYAGTRHNVGFEAIDKLACDHKIDVKKAKRRALVGEGSVCAQKCALIKPQTYMNASGESVRDNIEFHKASISEVIVVYDDTSLDVGEVRIRKQGSAGGHNGMKSIIYQLESDEFIRVRIGIGEKPLRWDLADYVLSKFKKDEMDKVIQGITKATDAIEVILKEGVEAAMNKYNVRAKQPNIKQKKGNVIMSEKAQFIEDAKKKFGALLNEQLTRIEKIGQTKEFIDYSELEKINIGITGGDGIGPAITEQAYRVLKFLLADEEKAGKVGFDIIETLTLENRIAENKAIPESSLEQLKNCHVILKGPTTTPQAGDGLPNVESANVAMRKELDLFANVRPVKVPELGIDWTFFRENTEGAYTLGSKGFKVTDDLAVDFTVTTAEGSRRIAKSAFEFAKNNGKTKVSCVTKANVVKTTDGMFLNICRDVAKEYEQFGITMDEWYIDIMTAKLIDDKRRRDFQVFVLPNLYGDILTDEAAEIQGGVGTAGSANIGKRYAMFEAIHGSAPRMVKEGRAKYADPRSVMRAAGMLLSHIGFVDKAAKLTRALDICEFEEKRLVLTGRDTGCTSQEFADYVMETLAGL